MVKADGGGAPTPGGLICMRHIVDDQFDSAGHFRLVSDDAPGPEAQRPQTHHRRAGIVQRLDERNGRSFAARKLDSVVIAALTSFGGKISCQAWHRDILRTAAQPEPCRDPYHCPHGSAVLARVDLLAHEHFGTQVVQHDGARREGFDQRALIASAEISFDTRDQGVELFDSAERLAESGAVQQLRLRRYVASAG